MKNVSRLSAGDCATLDGLHSWLLWALHISNLAIACAISCSIACTIVCVPAASAQGSRKDDIVFNAQGRPMAGATVRICTSAATGQPCLPLANIYSDAALTQALADPLTTDGLGNYSFYAAPGRYEVEISGPSITTKQLPNVILPNDPSTPTFTTVSTTSGISALSLSLGGNLTVSGSAAVTGTLTVGGGPVPSTAQANTWTATQTFQGPSPWVDVAAYGARAIGVSGYTTTCSVSSSSHSLTCAGPAQFHNGDGISLYGAGATNTMSAPGAPTVTPSLAAHATGTGTDVNAPAGSSSFSYKVVALGSWSATPTTNLWGAYTAAGSAGATSSGNALGSQTQTVSTLSEQTGVLTITCSASCPMAQGAYVGVSGTTNDGFFAGQYIVASVTNSTTFTVNMGGSTAATTTATGGTLVWYVCNHITWSAVTGAFEYAVYGRTSGSWTLLGFSWPGVMWFDDFGSTMTANLTSYGWLPTSAPSSAQNGALTTTVTAGGTTSNLTTTAAASNSVTSGFATFDDAPLMAAASTAAYAQGGPLFIPCNSSHSGTRFVIGSYLQLAGANPLNVQQCGSLDLDDPLEWDNGLSWFGLFNGNNNSAAPVSFAGGAEIDVNTAYPGVYSPAATQMFVDHTYLLQYPGSNMALLSDLQNGEGPGVIWQNSTWQTAFTNGANDYMGIHLLVGPNDFTPDNTFTNDSWIAGGPPEAPYETTTPLIIFNNTGLVNIDNCMMNRRTIAEIGGQPASVSLHVTKRCWVQGPITPFVMSNAGNVGIGGMLLEGILHDTSGQPLFANWSTGVLNGTVEIRSPSLDAPFQTVTGTGVANLELDDVGFPAFGPGAFGQNQNYSTSAAALIQTTTGRQGLLGAVAEHSMPEYQAQPNPQNFFIEQAPATPSSSASSGGSLTGTHNYGVVAFFPNGTSRTSSQGNSVTLSGGNGTIVSTWSAVLGAVSYDVWDLARGLPTACTGLTTTSCTDNGGGIGPSGGQPNAPSDGYPSLGPAGVYTPQITVGGDARISASPRPTTTVFLPGAFTTTWTGGTWTLDKAITVTRVQVQAKTAPAGCSTGAVVRLTDGTTPVSVTVSAAANDSGAITQNYAAAAALTIAVQTAASGCSTSPADANVIIQYRMQ